MKLLNAQQDVQRPNKTCYGGPRGHILPGIMQKNRPVKTDSSRLVIVVVVVRGGAAAAAVAVAVLLRKMFSVGLVNGVQKQCA